MRGIVVLAALASSSALATPPTVSMVASGTRGIAPYFFRIAWTVSNADSCAREGAWSTADEEGMPPIGEVQEMTLQDGWYTFTIRCRNAEGEASASTTIIVTQPMAP